MKQEQHCITLGREEYNILTEGSIIMDLCGNFLNNAIIKNNEVKLLLTTYQLERLLDSVASESDHAKSRERR